MAGSKAIGYAEQDLGVHAVYDEALKLASEASECRQQIAAVRRDKQQQEVLYLDAEYEFISDLRGANKDMSQTAFDKFSKVEVHRDSNLRSMRGHLASLGARIELGEANLSNLKLRCDIAVARLNELGGYFAYLAAVKAASASKGQDLTMNWPPDYRPGASAPQKL